MKRLSTIAAAALLWVQLPAQEAVPYSLPRTSLEFTVTAIRTEFTAGPYAAYASKYLGVQASASDRVSWSISEVTLRSFTEADPSLRYSYIPGGSADPAFLNLTSQGLVCGSGASFTVESGWKFPYASSHEFTVRPRNLTSAEGTLYSSGSRAVRQEVVVEKSEEAKAAEVAERIFSIRENKYNILVGDTDATYSGEAMKAAIDALDALEAELLSLFMGYSSTSEQTAVFEVIPTPGVQDAVAFRISESGGLVGPDDYSGSPVFVQIIPEAAAQPQEPQAPAKKGKAPAVRQVLHCRIPAICSVSLTDGETVLLRQRVPVYQEGTIMDYPIY